MSQSGAVELKVLKIKKKRKKMKNDNILLLKNMIIMKQFNKKFKIWKLKALKCHIKVTNGFTIDREPT